MDRKKASEPLFAGKRLMPFFWSERGSGMTWLFGHPGVATRCDAHDLFILYLPVDVVVLRDSAGFIRGTVIF